MNQHIIGFSEPLVSTSNITWCINQEDQHVIGLMFLCSNSKMEYVRSHDVYSAILCQSLEFSLCSGCRKCFTGTVICLLIKNMG